MTISRPLFIRVKNEAISLDAIASFNAEHIDDLRLSITLYDNRQYTLLDNEAIDAVMLLKPSLLEGRRLKWAKNAWLYHNLIGHPLMQLYAFFGCYEKAMHIHDSTIPRPLGRRGTSTLV